MGLNLAGGDDADGADANGTESVWRTLQVYSGSKGSTAQKSNIFCMCAVCRGHMTAPCP